MSSPLNITIENQPSKVLRVGSNDNNHLNVLKSKENIRKTTCSKTLKRKLKKYKLRRDGKEDPEVLNVSKALITSLRIKSPNYQEIAASTVSQDNESTPHNYLFKMVKQKRSCLKSDIKVINNESNSISVLHSTDAVTIDLKNSDTKQMNAFKLMMDSRNKSLGGNSPGKEICKDENEISEIFKKKELKAKRILSLERMAQEKGSVKNKEIEDFREECVKTQMLKRAERLKLMIEGSHFKSQEKVCNDISKKCLSEDLKDNDVKTYQSSPVKQKGTLKLFNFLSESEPCLTENKNIKKVTKEERDFLNKLSPSIKKKENMLSYFKKLPKEEPEEDDSCNSVIKVKFTSKAKTKSKQSKVVINSEEMGHISNDIDVIKARKKRKRERKKNEKNINDKDEKEKDKNENYENEKDKDEKTSCVLNNNERPKRNAKRPTKYADDIILTSSDEELHIFTPKKKRILDKNPKPKPGIKIIDLTNSQGVACKDKKINYAVESNKKNKNKSVEKEVFCKTIATKADKKNQEQSKNIKLAPIFVTKVPQNPLDLDAKQKFLQSGVPDILKVKSQQCNTALFTNTFHTVVHIQQLEKNHIILPKDWITFIDDSYPNFDENNDSTLFEKLLAQARYHNENSMFSKPKPNKLLKILKNAYPKFPVYRTYQLLKSKCQGEIKECSIQEFDNSIEIANSLIDTSNDNPERSIWNDKYRATSSKQIIGNFESIKELKRWLESWTENISKDKNDHNYESDLSDFCFSDTDTDSKDTFRNSNNILVITGPVGTGKTSSVYAVASELAIKVIEVNASSKRTGKIMLQDLQEATQSHKVNRGSNRVDSSQKSQEETITMKMRKKRGRPKKTYERSHRKSIENKQKKSEKVEKEVMSQQLDKCSQESSRTGMSLILIDDADIVFEQDDGFCSAISQLIQCSKRPVILITSSLKCPHLQKFLMCGKIIHMQPLLPRMLGTWLDIMCLADTSFCYPGLGSKILNYYSGDIRKTINFLQYFMTSDKYLYQIEDQTLSQVANTCKGNIDDENSSTSWADSEAVENNDCEKNIDIKTLKSFTDNNLALSLGNVSTNLFNIWWNMSSYLEDLTKPKESELYQEVNYPKRIAKTLDCISFIDALNIKKDTLQLDLASNPWHTNEVASVLENESLDCYNKCEDVISDISNELMVRAMSTQGLTNVSSPTISEERARSKIVSRHKTLTSHLYPSTMLDKKALALDYWPFCRTICRLEKTKTDINLKRNNRFCHYMKSVNVLCKNDFFDSLSESLS